MTRRLRHPSPSLVIAVIALFVSLGGTGYAALKVSGKNVKDSSLTGTDVKNSSLTGSDIKNRSLTAIDLKAGQLPAGPQGPQGALGPSGASLPPLPAATAVLPFTPGPGSCGSGRFCDDWNNYGNGYSPAAFSKDRSGLVQLQGSVAGLNSSSPMFVLPPGFRPPVQLLFPVFATHPPGVPLEGIYVSIGPDGSVYESHTDDISYLALDGIRFRP